MTAPFEPDPDRNRRLLNRTALGYAVAALLLLAVCCYGVFWLGRLIEQILSNLNGD
jgi:hypothetical protein